MSVLVAGGAGYIGSHLVIELIDAGEEVVVLDDLSTGFAWAVQQGVRIVRGDAGDAALVTRLVAEHRVDAVADFAANQVGFSKIGSGDGTAMPRALPPEI